MLIRSHRSHILYVHLWKYNAHVISESMLQSRRLLCPNPDLEYVYNGDRDWPVAFVDTFTDAARPVIWLLKYSFPFW